MTLNWSSAHDARMQTHYDLVNSTEVLKGNVGSEVIVVLFTGQHIQGTLRRVGWDYISIIISSDIEPLRIDFVKEGREEYVISSIRRGDNQAVIYDHINPKMQPFIPPDTRERVENII